MKKITVVYYGYVNEAVDWKNIIYSQLLQISQLGLIDISNLFIHITGPEHLWDNVLKYVRSILPDCTTYFSSVNKFEYPGIHLVWKLANESPDNLFLYFHSKGMSHGNERMLEEKKLFQEVIVNYEKALNIFHNNEKVNKIGLSASFEGWIWFNFWWARGSYLITCEEPIIETRRHYYEDWLHRKLPEFGKSSHEDCYSLVANKQGAFCAAGIAWSDLQNINLIQ